MNCLSQFKGEIKLQSKLKTVICDLQLGLDEKVAYDRGSLNTMSIYISKLFLAA